MKNIMLIILLAAVATLGSLYLGQRHKILEAETTIAALHLQQTELETRVEQQEQRTASLQTRLSDTRAKAVAKADQVTQLEQVLTNSAATNAKSSPLADMFKNPEMKELIKTQQKA